MVDAAEQAQQLTVGSTVSQIVHGYWSIDLEVLHTTATEQLPAFTAGLRRVLSSFTDTA